MKKKEVRNQRTKKARINRMLVTKALRSAKVIEVRNEIIDEMKNNRKHRIMIRNAKKNEIRKQKSKKARANRILVRKAIRSAKIIELSNEILVRRREETNIDNPLVFNLSIEEAKNNRKHRIMIRNTKKMK